MSATPLGFLHSVTWFCGLRPSRKEHWQNVTTTSGPAGMCVYKALPPRDSGSLTSLSSPPPSPSNCKVLFCGICGKVLYQYVTCLEWSCSSCVLGAMEESRTGKGWMPCHVGGTVIHQWHEITYSRLSVTDHSCVRLIVTKTAVCSWEEPAGTTGWSAVRSSSSAVNLRSEGTFLLACYPSSSCQFIQQGCCCSLPGGFACTAVLYCIQQGKLGTSSLIHGALVLIVGRQNRDKYVLCR